jgi:hypothetical protein
MHWDGACFLQVLREHNQTVDDARASIERLVPSDPAPLTDELKFSDEKEKQEVTMEQARFLLRLCLAISHVNDSKVGDPKATAAVNAVVDQDVADAKAKARRENDQDVADDRQGDFKDEIGTDDNDGGVGELVFEEFDGAVRPDIHQGVAKTDPQNNKFLLYASEPVHNFYLAFQVRLTSEP